MGPSGNPNPLNKGPRKGMGRERPLNSGPGTLLGGRENLGYSVTGSGRDSGVKGRQSPERGARTVA